MKITLENEFTIVTIEEKESSPLCYKAVELCVDAIVATGFSLDVVIRALKDVADARGEDV